MCMRRRWMVPFALGLLLIVPSWATAQQDEAQKYGTQKRSALARATDYSIPSVPALAFLDASPSTVHTPHFPRDLRVDWLIQDGQLASDLAIEAAPIWLFAFDEISAPEYRVLSSASRMLSTFNVSVATTRKGQHRLLALAGKVTVYQSSDPVADTSYTNRLSRALSFTRAQTQAQNTIDEIVLRAFEDTSLTESQRQAVDALGDMATQFGEFDPSSVSKYSRLSASGKQGITSYVNQLRDAHETMKDITDVTVQRLRSIRQAYEREHWNDTRVDVAAGRRYMFSSTVDGQHLDRLSLNTSSWGLWVNGATGFDTQNWLFSGLVRAFNRADGRNYFAGGNLRYGDDDANVFVEYAHRWGDHSVDHLVAYGGSISLTPRLNVQFGLRSRFDGAVVLRGLSPTMKLNGQTAEFLSSVPF